MAKKRSFHLALKLGVVGYAKEHSGGESAQQLRVDPKRIWDWHEQMGDTETTAAETSKLISWWRCKESKWRIKRTDFLLSIEGKVSVSPGRWFAWKWRGSFATEVHDAS